MKKQKSTIEAPIGNNEDEVMQPRIDKEKLVLQVKRHLKTRSAAIVGGKEETM